MLQGGGEEQGRRREEIGEENKQSSLEEISKCRAEAEEKVKERKERSKQAASNEAAKERNKQANKEATKAKDVTREKGQQGNLKTGNETQDIGQKGYGGAKDTIGRVDNITTPLAKKAQVAGSTTVQYAGEKSAQAKDATVGSMEKTTKDAKEREKAGTKGQTKKVKLNKNQPLNILCMQSELL